MTVAKWLQKHLESFKMPTEIHNDVDAGSRYLRPIFRDQSDLTPGILGDELRKHLNESKFLILICSEHSAQSAWVSDEAKAFVEMGRLDRIIPVIILSNNVPERALFPEYLRQYFKANPDKELLGVNIGVDGREKALIRIVSRLLDVSFDSLWKRHQRQKRIRIVLYSIIASIAIALTYVFAVPVDVSIEVNMQKAELPMGDSIVLTVNDGRYVSPSKVPSFKTIVLPGYKRFSDISLSAESQFYKTVDSIIPVGAGVHKTIAINLLRDNTFARYEGDVYDGDMNPLPNAVFTVNDCSSITDSNGHFSIDLPLSEQRAELPITLYKDGFQTITREDETPSRDLKYIMHRKQ